MEKACIYHVKFIMIMDNINDDDDHNKLGIIKLQ